MATYKRKPKKDSMIEIINTYSHDEDACISFFFNIKWPTGFYCEKCGCTHYYSVQRHHVFACKKCGHQHYLFSHTIFEGNKLPLFKLILGMYLFFSSNKGISALELASQLDINYKSALKLCRKCRVLMTLSNSEHILDSMFYEADTAYIGAKTSNKPGLSTDQQSIFVMLSTNNENSYPQYIKLSVIPTDNKHYMTKFVKMNAKLSKDRVLNTDGKTTFSELANDIQLKSEKINYDETNHRLYWLNIIVGNIKNNITGIYHGVTKQALPLFLHEQEWRFNHRRIGHNVLNKITKYIRKSFSVNSKNLSYILELSKQYFASCA